MEKSATIHYVVPESITNPAVRSQSVDIALTLQRGLAHPVIYYGLAKREDAALSSQSDEVVGLLRAKGVEVHIYDNVRAKGLFATLNLLLSIMRDVRRTLKMRPGPLLTRNIFGAMIAYLATRGITAAYYVVDLRGHGGAEMEMKGSAPAGSLKSHLYYLWERFLLENAHAVLCVSQPLAQYVRSSTKRTPLCYVVPSCIDQVLVDKLTQMVKQPKPVGVRPTGPVLTYAGTISDWNTLGPVLELFTRVQSKFPAARFLCLTPHTGKAAATLQSTGIATDRYEIRHVPHADMLSVLETADIGLLLREASPVNLVASPVKAGEYLAAGLAILATESIGDVSDLIRRERTGFLLPSLNPETWNDDELECFLNDLLDNRDDYRQRAIRTAVQYYVRTSYLDTYKEAMFGNGSAPKIDDR